MIEPGKQTPEKQPATQPSEPSRRAEDSLWNTGEVLAAVIQAAPVAIITFDFQGIVKTWNPAAERIFGWRAEEVIGKPLPYVPAEKQEESRGFMKRIAQGESFEGMEVRRVRKDGREVSLVISSAPLRDAAGHIRGILGIAADVTERKRAEEQLQAYAQKLQGLSAQLVKAQEGERRKIARDLHDQVGQALTAVQLGLQALLQPPVAAGLVPQLSDLLVTVDGVLEKVHDLSLDLRPAMLDDLGLEAALRWYTHRQAARAHLRSEFRAEALEERLESLIETACFRIAQEALTNVLRHAKAETVWVELRKTADSVHLLVRDNGSGFDTEVARKRAARGHTLGLLSMEERAALAGGRLEIKSKPGQGTEIHAWFPLKWRNRGERGTAG